jgi:hypothetical protein
MELNGQSHDPGCFIPEEIAPGANWDGAECIPEQAYAFVKGKSLTPVGNWTTIGQLGIGLNSLLSFEIRIFPVPKLRNTKFYKRSEGRVSRLSWNFIRWTNIFGLGPFRLQGIS